MEQLIKITETDGRQAVSAKELHAFLEIETPLTKWLLRMFEYGFIENRDWTKLSTDYQEVDYALTVDCAKHISMIQRTEKGMIARNYFIECEKKLLEKPKELSRKELALMVIEAEEARELAEAKIKELAPKAEVYDRVMSSEDLIDLGEAAKILKLDFGRNTLFKKLREMGVLMRDNIPYQQYITRGYFKCIEGHYVVNDESRVHIKTMITQKGVQWLTEIF